MKRLMIAVFLMSLLAAVGMVAAQDDVKLCDATLLTAPAPDGKSVQDALVAQMEVLTEAAKAGDVAAWLKGAADLRFGLGLVESECAGRYFSSEGKGLKAVVGPIGLPDGIWKAVLHSDGMLTTVKVTSVSGTCHDGFLDTIFTVSQTPIDAAQETIIKPTGGCIALFEIENIGGKAWDFSLQPVSLNQ